LTDCADVAINLNLYGTASGCGKIIRNIAKEKVSESVVNQYMEMFDNKYASLSSRMSPSYVAAYFGLKDGKSHTKDEIKAAYRDMVIKNLGKNELKKLPGNRLVTGRSANTYAWASRNGAVALGNFSKSDFTKTYQSDIDSGYHPKTDKSLEEACITHELGHSVMFFVDPAGAGRNVSSLSGLYNSNKNIKTELSRYANENVAEMCAEAFCAYRTSNNPSVFAKLVYKNMLSLYRRTSKRRESIRNAYLGV
jgi:hypothetical protein